MSAVTLENYARLGMNNFGKTQSLNCYEIYHKLIGQVMTGRRNFVSSTYNVDNKNTTGNTIKHIWLATKGGQHLLDKQVNHYNIGGYERLPYCERIVFVEYPSVFQRGNLV